MTDELLIKVLCTPANLWIVHARHDEIAAWTVLEDDDLDALLRMAHGIVTGETP